MHRSESFERDETSAADETSASVGRTGRKGVSILYPLYFVVIVGVISVVHWFSFYRFFAAYEGIISIAGGAIPKVGYVSAAIFATPFLVFLGIAVLYFYFPRKKVYRMSFTRALFHVGLACTPVALNGMILLLECRTGGILSILSIFEYCNRELERLVHYSYLNPFPPLLSPYLHYIIEAPAEVLLHYHAAWIASILIYVKLAQVGKWWPVLLLVTWVVVFITWVATAVIVFPHLD